MEVLNNRGPLFKYTQDYNLNAVVPVTFHWVNQIPHTFVDIRDIDNTVGKHYDRISLSMPVTYTQILEAIVKFSPRMLYIHKTIVNDGTLPELGPDPIKLENLKTLVYTGDLKLDFIARFLPNIKHLYIESLNCLPSSTPTASNECVHNGVFGELKNFSCTLGSSFALSIIAPNLVEFNVYKMNGRVTAAGNDYHIDLNNYPSLRILRVPDNVRVIMAKDAKSSVLLNTLQFFFNVQGAVNDSLFLPDSIVRNDIRGFFDGNYYIELVARYKPKFLILPPNVLSSDQLEQLPELGVQSLGISVHENLAINCFSLFSLLEVYDSYNMHAAMSVRQTTNLEKYVSRIYKSIHTKVEDLISGIDIRKETEATAPSDKPYLLMLFNFEPYDKLYMTRWMYMIENFRQKVDKNPILILRCEIVKTRNSALGDGVDVSSTLLYDKAQFAWPSVVQCLRKRIIIINTQTKLLHLDISLNSIQNIIALVKRIYKIFEYEKIVIITHGFTISDTNIVVLKRAIPLKIELNIHGVPYKVYS